SDRGNASADDRVALLMACLLKRHGLTTLPGSAATEQPQQGSAAAGWLPHRALKDRIARIVPRNDQQELTDVTSSPDELWGSGWCRAVCRPAVQSAESAHSPGPRGTDEAVGDLTEVYPCVAAD